MPATFVVFSAVVVIASLFGGWLPTSIRMTHLRMQLVLSLVSGVMLGVATIHLIPQAVNYLQSVETTMAVALVGILLMFFLNRIFHFHQHDVIAAGEPRLEHSAGCDHEHGHHHVHDHVHDHGHGGHVGRERPPADLPTPAAGIGGDPSNAQSGAMNPEGLGLNTLESEQLSTRDISGFGLFFGMAVHSLLDGVALGAAVFSEPHSHWSATGFSVFLAIALHKPLDAMSITSLMAARGWRIGSITAINVLFSFLTPLGALLFLLGTELSGGMGWLAGMALALSAGVFLCISLGDLLPELHFHRHDRAWLSVALLAGILVAVMIELLPGHTHGGPVNAPNSDSKATDSSS